jgi:hypothetical protein
MVDSENTHAAEYFVDNTDARCIGGDKFDAKGP